MNTEKINQYKRQLDSTNKTIRQLEVALIKDIQTKGLELIDLYYYINQMSTLKTRKNTLTYLISIETIRT